MMELYAPRIENDTDKYVGYITAKSGVDKEAIVGRLSEAELSALMQAMEQYEGFNAKADTRKETWVRTTKITLSDGARPISGQEVTIKQGSTTIQHKTNTYGQLPAIPHVSPRRECGSVDQKCSQRTGENRQLRAWKSISSLHIFHGVF